MDLGDARGMGLVRDLVRQERSVEHDSVVALVRNDLTISERVSGSGRLQPCLDFGACLPMQLRGRC